MDLVVATCLQWKVNKTVFNDLPESKQVYGTQRFVFLSNNSMQYRLEAKKTPARPESIVNHHHSNEENTT